MSEQINYLSQLVECMLDQDKWNSLVLKPQENIPVLYQNTQKLIKQYEQHFNRCRKYNQAKIHRKYQIIISDLRQQNSDLKAKIGLELSARPSSQKYVSDLIDKMVVLQNQNQQLTTENNSLSSLVKSYEYKYQLVMNPSSQQQEEENPQSKSLLKKEWEQKLIHQTVTEFSKKKKAQLTSQPTPFEKFVDMNKHKFERWTLKQLIQRLDRWTSHLKDTRILDKVKIKHRLQHSGLQTEKYSSLMTANPNYSTIERATTGNRSVNPSTTQKKRGMQKQASFRLKPINKSALKMDMLTIE